MLSESVLWLVEDILICEMSHFVIDVQKAHSWIFLVNSEKTTICNQIDTFSEVPFYLDFCEDIQVYIRLTYGVYKLVEVVSVPAPKRYKNFNFFNMKFFQGTTEISTEKCTFWVQIL